jgi:hypothetical protein
LAALLLVSWTAYWPIRARSQHRVASAVAFVYGLPGRFGLDRAVLFAPVPYVPSCLASPASPQLGWWPLNDPDFENPILYANHISLEDDRRLVAEHFPDREGFVIVHSADCRVGIAPLASDLDPAQIPPGLPGGLAAQPDAGAQGWLSEAPR